MLHKKDGSDSVAEYTINGKKYQVDACYSKDTPEGEYDFYDVYDAEEGTCVNFGDPFEYLPTQAELAAYLESKKG